MQGRYKPFQFGGIEGLVAVGERPGRVLMHLQHYPVGPGGHCGPGQRPHDRRPVPWLGSAITGKWESSLRAGMALISMVFRV